MPDKTAAPPPNPAPASGQREKRRSFAQWRQHVQRNVNNTRITLGVALLFTLLVASIFPTPPIIFMTALLGAAPVVGSLAGRLFARCLRLVRAVPSIGTIGDEIEGRLELRNAAAWPTFFARAVPGECEAICLVNEGEHIVPVLRGGGESHFVPRWQLMRRGVWQLPPAKAGVFDPLGLFHSLNPRTGAHQITVLPRPVPISRLGFLVGSQTGSPAPQHAAAVAEATDFHGIRAWRPGDSVRRVHWKSTARTGITHIIEWEETLASDITLVLDVRCQDERTRDWFECAVTLVASVAAHVLENGHRFDLYCWQHAPDRTAQPVLCHHQARSAGGLGETLMFLAALETLPEAPLAELSGLVRGSMAASQYSTEFCAVMVASSNSDWEDAAVRLNGFRAQATTLLIEEDSFLEAGGAPTTSTKPTYTHADTPRERTAPRVSPLSTGRVRRAARGDSVAALLEQ